MKSMILTILSATLLLAVPYASAQQSSDNRIPTNLPNIFTSPQPPDGFDPLAASDDQLAVYGFPPRPDKTVAPSLYSVWEKAIKASKKRITPILQVTNRYHGPNVAVGKVQNSTANSYNWSGIVDTTPATSYGPSSVTNISSEFVVPVASQAFGACTGRWDYSSSWVGIDGWNSNDVLQAGTESDAYCNGGVQSTNYDAWFEWAPYPEVVISGLSVSPGTDMWVAVWSSNATTGHAYVLNYNTNTAATITFSAPPGTNLIGNSAEWVVERPLLTTGYATLTNYISDYFSGSSAGEGNSAFGFTLNFLSPTSPGAIAVTMLDNGGIPISTPTALLPQISWCSFYPCFPLYADIEFQDEGSAR